MAQDAFERVRLVGLNDQNNGLIEQELSIREKYAPYTPQLRPWLVIIEVNMTETSLNTECTGENNGFLAWLNTKFFNFLISGAVLSPWWVITSRSCACGDNYGCNLATFNEKQMSQVFVYPGYRPIKSFLT